MSRLEEINEAWNQLEDSDGSIEEQSTEDAVDPGDAEGQDASSDTGVGIESPEVEPEASGRREGGEESEEGGTDAGELDGQQEQATGEAEAAETAEASDTASKPPANWGPAVREEWGNLPAPVQEQILKREKDFDYRIQKNTEAAKRGEAYDTALKPFESIMAMEGADGPAAVRNLAQTAAVLRVGTDQEKARVVTSLIQAYGIDLPTLDEMLSAAIGGGGGEHPSAIGTPGGTDIQALIRNELAPMREFMSNYQNNTEASAKSDIEAFAADPANEFYADVSETMADLMEAAAARGQSMSLEDAYRRACALDDEIQGVLAARQAATETANAADALQSRREAASSISGAPVGGAPKTAPKNRREALGQAWEEASGGGGRL